MKTLLPDNYLDRVYAGVLGKVIGVYSGKPFEQWSHAKIMDRLGEVWYYAHEGLDYPLIAADDDISGTFTFLRALEDFDIASGDAFTPEHVARTWLNYIIEGKSVLWWGGMGVSTEHTAFLRLKRGVRPPESGSMAVNGRTVAEQIGSQIFIDGWGLVAPGRVDLAADLARKAACVSHDGEAIHGAVVVAVLVSAAFVEQDLDAMLDTARSLVPRDATIGRVMDDLRALRQETEDWRQGLELIHERYSYALYGGGCHIVPNHAVVLLALIWGGDDFQRALMISNTAGYDTDCNTGNVGCILGVKLGLDGIDRGPDWRGPVADRVLIPTADGGSCVTDCAAIAVKVANWGRRLAGEPPVVPKGGARFHFALPGSVQGFVADDALDARGIVRLGNTDGRLSIDLEHLGVGRVGRVATMIYPTPEIMRRVMGYGLTACPTLSPGQTVSAVLAADEDNPVPIEVRLYIDHLVDLDETHRVPGPEVTLRPGDQATLYWPVPEVDGFPIVRVGLECRAAAAARGRVYLDTLGWSGSPTVCLSHTKADNRARDSQWVAAGVAVFAWHPDRIVISEPGRERGLLIHGTREWTDYTVSTDLNTKFCAEMGLAVRVRGLCRYHAFLHTPDGRLRLVRVRDEERTTLADAACPWRSDEPVEQARRWSVTIKGHEFVACIDGQELIRTTDEAPIGQLPQGGGIALVIHDGQLSAGPVRISPVA